MPESTHSITYAGKSIPFHLRYSTRKSLEIAVHPDRSVIVKAPLGMDQCLVEQRVHKRASWINRQLRYFEQFKPRAPKRRFVGGESHLYLGRKYRLKIRQSETEKVSLTRGFFHVTSVDAAPEHVAKLLHAWYRQKADAYFAQVLEACWRQHHFEQKGVAKPALKIRAMKTRWGSLSKRGRMTLNLELIKAPRACIEYVIVHELCHLLHLNHGRAFYTLLECSLPDWKQCKHKLERVLSEEMMSLAL